MPEFGVVTFYLLAIVSHILKNASQAIFICAFDYLISCKHPTFQALRHIIHGGIDRTENLSTAELISGPGIPTMQLYAVLGSLSPHSSTNNVRFLLHSETHLPGHFTVEHQLVSNHTLVSLSKPQVPTDRLVLADVALWQRRFQSDFSVVLALTQQQSRL